ncbi:unnamed protein product, partial [Adineta steineri]
FTPRIISSGYYYPVLILLLAVNDFVMTMRAAAHIGFFASISEPRIGGTYMTFLVTLSNLGFAVNSSTVLYVANLLPKKYAYVIAVGASSFLGIVWFVLSFRMVKQLQKLPTYKWYIKQETTANKAVSPEKKGQNEHEMSLISDKKPEYHEQ